MNLRKHRVATRRAGAHAGPMDMKVTSPVDCFVDSRDFARMIPLFVLLARVLRTVRRA